MTSGRYSFLLIEDNPLDAELAEQCLRKSGLEFDIAFVDSRAGFLAEFENHTFDLILADYSLPDFDGLTALDIVRTRYKRLPFIFVSGVLGEDVAVETMLRGATDYVLKQKLERLVPAVMRALAEHADYLLREKAEKDLRAAEAEAEANARRQSLLLELLQRQRTLYNPESLMLAAAQAIGEYLGVDRAGFYEASESGSAHFIGSWTSAGAGPLSDAYLQFESMDPQRLAAYRSGTIAAFPDVQSASDTRRLVANGIRAFIGSPICRHGKWCGGFYVTHSSPRDWAPEEVSFVKEIGDLTWDSVERARAVVALEASEERLRTAAETANLGSWELDLAHGTMTCSAQCKANFGWPSDRPFNYSDLQASIHPDDREYVMKAVQDAIANHDLYRAEYRNLWSDGSVHWTIASGRVHYDEAGVPQRMLGFTLDVTERHKAQIALLQSEKLAAVGRLASSIAHEINNPLESVTNLLYLANISGDTAEIKRYLRTAEQELRRVSAIANQTLRFHRQSSGPRAVRLKDLFDAVLSMYQGRLLNSRVQVSLRVRDTHAVECLDGEIRQVLNNLVANSIDAMQSTGGCLALRSYDATLSDGQPAVAFIVGDSGAGMSTSVCKNAFDAFFTTKGSNGTGLGLWVSKGIVDRHGGTMRFYSSQREQRHGTVCSIVLPCKAQLTS